VFSQQITDAFRYARDKSAQSFRYTRRVGRSTFNILKLVFMPTTSQTQPIPAQEF
jgi:hypothetical protein